MIALCLPILTFSAAAATQGEDLGEIRSAAEQGDARALDRLGNAYWRGRGVPLDIARGEAYFRQAIAAGRERSRINLSRLLMEAGRGQEAFVVMEEARALGLEGVEYWLAVGHVRGLFGLESTPQAGHAELERLSAEGDERATYALADALDGGAAIDPDPARAWTLYQMLADTGDARALARLGNLAWRGLGTTKDLDEAQTLMQSAIDAGEPRAVINLSRVLIEAGQPDRARAQITAAVDAGLEGADFWLARFNARGDFGHQSDQDAGLAELERLSANGNVNATSELARLAGQSHRTPIDPVEIAARLETASAAGSDRATLALLRLLRERSRRFPDGTAQREAILSQRGDQLTPDRRVPEEVRLIADQKSGRTQYRAVSDQLSGQTADAFQRGFRAALSADRRAYTWVLQERLAEQGFYTGRINGWMTTRTIHAFRRFCRKNEVDHICTHGPLRGEAATTIAPFL